MSNSAIYASGGCCGIVRFEPASERAFVFAKSVRAFSQSRFYPPIPTSMPKAPVALMAAIDRNDSTIVHAD